MPSANPFNRIPGTVENPDPSQPNRFVPDNPKQTTPLMTPGSPVPGTYQQEPTDPNEQSPDPMKGYLVPSENPSSPPYFVPEQEASPGTFTPDDNPETRIPGTLFQPQKPSSDPVFIPQNPKQVTSVTKPNGDRPVGGTFNPTPNNPGPFQKPQKVTNAKHGSSFDSIYTIFDFLKYNFLVFHDK